MPPPRDCANPLFLMWLEELRDKAKERGMKVAEVYGKGCRSLAACPVKYSRPCDLVVLAGIGPRTAQELDKKLRAHCEETGTPYPASPARPQKRKDKENIPTTSTGGRSVPTNGRKRGEALNIPSDLEDSEDEGAPRPKKTRVATNDAAVQPKKKSAPKAKIYVPVPRSGAHGILIGMLIAHDNPDDAINLSLTRGEIISRAQPFCDASYDHSERGTWVTAWNAMKTLVNKGYVFVSGMPHRYTLTYEGFDVAASLRNAEEVFKGKPEIKPFCHRKEAPVVGGYNPSWAKDKVQPPRPEPVAGPSRTSASSAASLSRTAANPPARFAFWYLDNRGRRVENLTEAKMVLDPVEFIALRLIEFPDSLKSHPIVSQLRQVDDNPTLHESGMVTITGCIVEEGAPPKCSGFDDKDMLSAEAKAKKPSPKPPRVSAAGSPPGRSAGPIPTASPPTVSRKTSALSATSSSRTVTSTTSYTTIAGPSRPSLSTNLSMTSQSSSMGGASLPRPPRLGEQMPLPGDSVDIPKFTIDDAMVFRKGMYEIILVLDSREVESRSNRDRIQEALARKGVKVETRALRLGDMCWVARRLDSFGAEEHECVLDYVVERKRLDDLCSSIKDGRYSEQCFRLGDSGIKNVFYIVEDYQKAVRMQTFGKAITTAKSQVQVINDFFLKETHKLNDTIDYLVTMTKVIKEMSGDLHVIPSRYLSRTTYSALQRSLRETYPDKAFLTSYEAFQQLNKKTSMRTVKEYLARSLLRIKGMSPERVSAVLDMWDTPRALYEAMRAREQQGVLMDGRKKRGPELMFADYVQGEGRRKIGDALSKKIWHSLWGESTATKTTTSRSTSEVVEV